MDRTRQKATVLFAGLALTSSALINPGAQAAPVTTAVAAQEAGPRIAMKRVAGAVVGGTWKVQGRIARAGRAKNKTIIVEWKAGSSRFPTPSARTAVANKAGWARIGILRRQNDGKYSIKFESDTPGTSQIRVRLVAGKRTLDKSPAKTLTIVEAPPTTTTVPEATPGTGPLTSGITGQVSATNPLMAEFMTNIYNNVYNYWNANYAAWGYGSTSVSAYWPAVGEEVYNGCDQVYEVNDTAAYYCSVNDYIIFSQQAAVDFWNGAYAQTPSAQPGDFAVAMVMAHEFGHNITWELWPNARAIFTTYQREGFADCLAGTWANSVYYQGLLEAGDIEEAIATFISFGSGALSGYPNGDERAQYFLYGYNTGSPADCATAIL